MRQEQDWRDDLRAARYLGVAPWELADHADWRERALIALVEEESAKRERVVRQKMIAERFVAQSGSPLSPTCQVRKQEADDDS
jgi:hypothetical protein